VCPSTGSRQNGRDSGEGGSAPHADRHWREYSVEELRSFMRELVLATSLREAARLIDRGHEMVRKFIDGTIQRPQERTRKAMAELLIARTRLVDRVRTSPSTPTAGQLTVILPKGVDAAVKEIRRVFAIVKASEKAPPSAEQLENWLVRRVQEEYATDVRYRPVGKKKEGDAPKGKGAAAEKRRGKGGKP
jgi:hypothetical protein